MNQFKLYLLVSYIGIASFSGTLITPALPLIEKTYQLSHSALEWIVSIFLLGYVLGQLIYGPLANRFGRLTALRMGLVLNITGIIFCIFSTNYFNYNLLLCGRFITGLGVASCLSCIVMLINELPDPKQVKQAFAATVIFFTASFGIAVAIGGSITEHLHWTNCFNFLLLHAFIVLILTWLFKETLKKPIALQPYLIFSNYRAVLKNAQLVIFALPLGLVCAINYGYSAAAPQYAHAILKLSPEQYGYWSLLNTAAMIISGFLNTQLTKRYSTMRLFFLALALLIPGLISMNLIAHYKIPNILWFFSTTAYLCFCTGLIYPVASLLASKDIKDQGSAASMMSFINMGTGTIAIIFMGHLPVPIITAFAFMLTTFFILMSSLITYFVFKNRT